MGALFRLPVLEMNESEVFNFFDKNNITSYASTPKNTAEKSLMLILQVNVLC